MGNKLVNFTVERSHSHHNMYMEILKNKIVVIFMRDQTSTVIVFIYSGIVLTEEQIMAHHDFFIRRYNVDADPVK